MYVWMQAYVHQCISAKSEQRARVAAYWWCFKLPIAVKIPNPADPIDRMERRPNSGQDRVNCWIRQAKRCWIGAAVLGKSASASQDILIALYPAHRAENVSSCELE